VERDAGTVLRLPVSADPEKKDAGEVLRLSCGTSRSEEGNRKHLLRRNCLVAYQIQLHRRPVLLLQEEVKKWKEDQESLQERCQGSL
jgi:hypothetical protein